MIESFYVFFLSFCAILSFQVHPNDTYDFLPKQLEDKGMTIVADIGKVLRDARAAMENGEGNV